MSDGQLFCVELRTADWARMVDWYRDVAGLRVVVRQTAERYALLVSAESAGGGRLSIVGRDELPPGGPRWSLAFETKSLATVAERLRRTGPAATEPRATAEGFLELITADPDGNRVRFFAWPGT